MEKCDENGGSSVTVIQPFGKTLNPRIIVFMPCKTLSDGFTQNMMTSTFNLNLTSHDLLKHSIAYCLLVIYKTTDYLKQC